MAKPCRKCGGTNRHPSGNCAPCASRRSKQWYQSNPEKAQGYNNRRRALKANAQSESYDFKACRHYDNRCVSCGRSDLSLTTDHIVPLSWGGSDTADNIQPLCDFCNKSKGNHHQTDYRDDQGPPLPKQLSFWRRK